MTVWLLGLILLASAAGLGYRQGAIRVAFSLVGIIIGALVAVPLGKTVKPLLTAVGLKNPALIWALGPVIVFFVVSILFKVGAFTVHHKVDVYFKYKAGDLRLALWERLNHRVGLCLGLFNGAVYFILIAFVIYPISYWTFQMANPDSDPKAIRLTNRLGQDLQSTGFNKVARSIDTLPASYYDTADIVGLIYNNSLLEARVSRYPAFLGLGERPEFQDIASDKQFTEMRQRHEPIMNLIDYPKAKAIIDSPDTLKLIWSTLEPNLADFRAYLETGKSAKYDSEKILGRWDFDVNGAMGAMRRAKPNISSTEMQKVKRWMASAFSKTSFVATTDHQAILKNLPQLKPSAGAAAGAQTTLQGQWKNADGKYQVEVASGGTSQNLVASIEGERMSLATEGMSLVFIREE